MDNLKAVIESAINRELTEKELLYVEWLARMDYETIDVFVELFKDAIKK